MKQIPDWLRCQPIAHRGLHNANVPENSLGAFKAAADAGYAIELDIHCSADGQLVVAHDDSTKRLTGSDLLITKVNFDQLKPLRLLGTTETIPSLPDVLSVVNGKVPLLIEVKPGTPAGIICPILMSLLDTYEGDVAVQSFDPRIVSWFATHQPSIVRGQLSASFRSDKTVSGIRRLLLRSMVMNLRTTPDFIAYSIEDLPSHLVAFWLKKYHAELLVWTVRTAEQVELAKQYNANIIFESIRP